MKKNVLTFGAICGTIITSMMVYAAWKCNSNPQFESNDVLGYAGILVAFSFIFVGIKNYRDKYNGGIITFGNAFKAGFYMSLVASAMYLVVWLIDYYIFIPGYIDQFITHTLHQAKMNGATQETLDKTAVQMAEFKELYKNPLFVIAVTLAEVLPIGVVISLISALILKRKAVQN